MIYINNRAELYHTKKPLLLEAGGAHRHKLFVLLIKEEGKCLRTCVCVCACWGRGRSVEGRRKD